MFLVTSLAHHLVPQIDDRLANILVPHNIDALIKNDLTLIIHDVVVLEHILACIEVARFDLLLRFLQGLVDPGVRNRLAFLQPELLQHAVHAIRPEDTHRGRLRGKDRT